MDGNTFFSFPTKDIHGNDVASIGALCPEAKATLVVNVASK